MTKLHEKSRTRYGFFSDMCSKVLQFLRLDVPKLCSISKLREGIELQAKYSSKII